MSGTWPSRHTGRLAGIGGTRAPGGRSDPDGSIDLDDPCVSRCGIWKPAGRLPPVFRWRRKGMATWDRPVSPR